MLLNSVLVTGANRGIGFGIVEYLANMADPPNYIFATYRDEQTSQKLKDVQSAAKKCQVVLLKLDVSIPEQVEGCRGEVERAVGEDGLTLLINNAALWQDEEAFPDVSEENLLLHFKVNTLGPLAMLKAFLPLLEKSARRGSLPCCSSGMNAGVLNMASNLTILKTAAGVRMPKRIGYRIGKVGMHMAMQFAAAEVGQRGILVVQVFPGQVRTDLCGSAGEVEVSDAVRDIFHTLSTKGESLHGCCVDRFGNALTL